MNALLIIGLIADGYLLNRATQAKQRGKYIVIWILVNLAIFGLAFLKGK